MHRLSGRIVVKNTILKISRRYRIFTKVLLNSLLSRIVFRNLCFVLGLKVSHFYNAFSVYGLNPALKSMKNTARFNNFFSRNKNIISEYNPIKKLINFSIKIRELLSWVIK